MSSFLPRLAFEFVQERIRAVPGGSFQLTKHFHLRNSDDFSDLFVLTAMKSGPRILRRNLKTGKIYHTAKFEIKFKNKTPSVEGEGVRGIRGGNANEELSEDPEDDPSIVFESGLVWKEQGEVTRYQVVDNVEGNMVQTRRPWWFL